MVLVLQGCLHQPPSAPHFTVEDYGPPPVRHEEVIKQFFDVTLKDPFSAQYRFQEPTQAYNYKTFVDSEPSNPGWLVNVEVNAKNSYGAYIGWKRYAFLIKNELITWSKPLD
jgi:hypothetical protein